MMRSVTLTIFLVTLGISVASCQPSATTTENDKGKKPAVSEPAKDPANGKAKTPISSTPAADNKVLFTPAERKTARINWVVCATCHGQTGQGDGLVGMALNPRPRDFTDAKWQAEVTDERLFKVIKGGGAAVGLSPLMVGYPHLSDGTIHALIHTVRSLAKK
jgi:cytochrome c553